MIRLASPLWLALILAAAFRLWLLWNDRRENAAAFRFSNVSRIPVRSSLRAATSWIPIALEILGWICLVVALARPQRVTSTAADERLGIDIVIALDASGSMAAEDFRPRNRFTVAKELVAQFIEGRKDDRIGIVTFGARAATRVPITYDREIAAAILERAEIGENGDGTAIGHAIATSVNRLRNSKSRSRLLILLTDGVNNAGSIEPATAAALASRFGVKIYAIGVGSRNAEVPIPIKVQNRFTGEIETVIQYVRAELDEELLTAIAKQTGGSYFRATDPQALEAVLARVDALEKTKLAGPKQFQFEELYHAPLLLSLLFVALSLLGGETIWMRLPA